MDEAQQADAVIGIAVGGAAMAWCRQYGLNIEASFAYSKYGFDGATNLAMERCRRMNHFYDIYLLRDEPDYSYSAQDLASYEEDLPWLDYLCAQDVASAVWARAEVVRGTKPQAQPKPAGSSSSTKRKKR